MVSCNAKVPVNLCNTDISDSDSDGPGPRHEPGFVSVGKGQMGSALIFDRGTVWVLPLSYFNLPKSARAYLFPQSVKLISFAASPLVLTCICPQP